MRLALGDPWKSAKTRKGDPMVMTTSRGWRSRRHEKHAFAVQALMRDDMAELLGEQFVLCATSAEDVAEEIRNQVSDQEVGGPFIEGSTP
jgi:hypothetical protein